MGLLTPVLCQECYPGDRFSIRTENFLRFAPLVSPVMHRIHVKTEYFFVPNRILWPEWEDFITGKSDAAAPYFEMNPSTAPPEKSLFDYLGYPTAYDSGDTDYVPIRVSPMPLAAYWRIWNEWYRHQDLQLEQETGSLISGDNTSAFAGVGGQLAYRGWQRDYFTSSLPYPQQGSDPVQVPLTEALDIPVDFSHVPSGASPGWRNPTTGATIGNGSAEQDAGDAIISTAGGNIPAGFDPDGTLTVDVQAGAVTIERLRQAFRLQEFLERTMRGGQRYTEQIYSHFGVRSSDARLQRPELIGTMRQNMVISEVLSTAQSDNDPDTATVPVGQMAGHGISVGGGRGVNYTCEEHGWIIGLITVMPVTAYQDGLDRKFSRFDRLDYMWPTFANLGEQEVKNKEIKGLIGSGFSTDPEAVWGYQGRYNELRQANSRTAGEFKSSLDFWTLTRIYNDGIADFPALTGNFIGMFDVSRRIFAVTDPSADQIYAHITHDISANRRLPRFNIPTI